MGVVRKWDIVFMSHLMYILIGGMFFLLTTSSYNESPSILNICCTVIACFIFCYGLVSLKRDIKKGGFKAVKKTMSGK